MERISQRTERGMTDLESAMELVDGYIETLRNAQAAMGVVPDEFGVAARALALQCVLLDRRSRPVVTLG